jgi:hypothetical protein
MKASESTPKSAPFGVMVKEIIPQSMTLTRLLATTAVIVEVGSLEAPTVVPTIGRAMVFLVASVCWVWTVVVKEMTLPVIALVAEAAQALTPTTVTKKLAEPALPMVTVILVSATTQLEAISE